MLICTEELDHLLATKCIPVLTQLTEEVDCLHQIRNVLGTQLAPLVQKYEELRYFSIGEMLLAVFTLFNVIQSRISI